MMHVLPCVRVRDDLAAYHDGELPMEERVLIQGHLQECVACRLEAAMLTELGDALRTMAGAVPGRSHGDTGRISGTVLDRIRVENQLSFTTRVRCLFEDMHLVWAGLGATLATLFCVFASAGVLQAASQERPDSLAGIINTIVAADANDPMRLAPTVIENRALLDTTEAMQSTGGDAELMLSALVTREGRIQNLEVLEEQARALHVKPEVMLAMIEAASRARFERQSGHLGGAINVVWLVTTTTVKGQPGYDQYLVSPPPWPEGIIRPVLPRKVTRAPAKSSTAGDGLDAEGIGPGPGTCVA
jgi:putative zinc finger protein